MQLKKLFSDLSGALKAPKLNVDLGRTSVQKNDPYFLDVVNDFYQSATKRHPKLPVIPSLKYGIALLQLPETPEEYLKMLESSARRNIKKSKRNGYTFQRINYNDYLEDISEIHGSTAVRQGEMDPEFMNQKLKPITNPVSLDDHHDYAYFGVVKDGKVVAYAGCMIAGEMLLLQTIFGHDKYKSDAVVPNLIAGIAEYKYSHYPHVKHYVYDKYYGASENLRRFKKKFRFEPHTVSWQF
ncbi:MAG: hypothetical protein ACI8WB_001849 [Phenylobacterium sp.]|jgi:hypothetical protein